MFVGLYFVTLMKSRGLFVFLVWIRRTEGVRGRRVAYFAGAMAIVAVSVWAANSLSSVHRFGAP